jgi:hypothetical protein
VTPDFPWEFGLDTFGDLAYDASGTPLSPAASLRALLAEPAETRSESMS